MRSSSVRVEATSRPDFSDSHPVSQRSQDCCVGENCSGYIWWPSEGRRRGGGGCRKEDKRAKLRRRVEVEEERIRGLLSVSVGINLLLQLAFHFTGDWYLQLTTSFYCISLAVSIQSFTIGISFHWQFQFKVLPLAFHFKVVQLAVSFQSFTIQDIIQCVVTIPA